MSFTQIQEESHQINLVSKAELKGRGLSVSSAEAGTAEQSLWEEAGAGLQEFGVTSPWHRIPAQTWGVLPALTMHLPRSKAGLFQKHPGADNWVRLLWLVLHVGLAPVGARLQTGASAELMSG